MSGKRKIPVCLEFDTYLSVSDFREEGELNEWNKLCDSQVYPVITEDVSSLWNSSNRTVDEIRIHSSSKSVIPKKKLIADVP